MNCMNLRCVLTGCLVVGLAALTNFQSVRADTVQATAHVTAPTSGQIFYTSGTTLPDVLGSASYSANYQNGDPVGTAPKYVPTHVTYTFIHANPGGTSAFVNIDAYGTYGPGDTFAPVGVNMSAHHTFAAGYYVTSARASIEADAPTVTYRAAGGSDVNWTVVVGEDNTPPSGGSGCQVKGNSSKKPRRQRPAASHFAL